VLYSQHGTGFFTILCPWKTIPFALEQQFLVYHPDDDDEVFCYFNGFLFIFIYFFGVFFKSGFQESVKAIRLHEVSFDFLPEECIKKVGLPDQMDICFELLFCLLVWSIFEIFYLSIFKDLGGRLRFIICRSSVYCKGTLCIH